MWMDLMFVINFKLKNFSNKGIGIMVFPNLIAKIPPRPIGIRINCEFLYKVKKIIRRTDFSVQYRKVNIHYKV